MACLAVEAPIGDDVPELVTGLMSMRHQDIDGPAHSYWFRNADLSTGGPQAAAAAFAEGMAINSLEELETPARIVVHMTGFNPAIVGLLRAVAGGHGPRGTVIVPTYFDGRETVKGRPWRIGA